MQLYVQINDQPQANFYLKITLYKANQDQKLFNLLEFLGQYTPLKYDRCSLIFLVIFLIVISNRD